MATTINEIEACILGDPFEISSVKLFEGFLQQQVSMQQYHFEANKLLLKNYQCNSQLVNVQNISQILILSLMHLPSTDYLSLSYLVPSTIANSSAIATIAICANHLERGNFADFWKEYNRSTDVFSSVSGFVSAMRNFILNSLGSTFKNIPVSQFCELLDLQVSNFEDFISLSKTLEVSILLRILYNLKLN